MSFQAPNSDIVKKAEGFKAPEQDIVQPSQTAQNDSPPSFVDQLNSVVGKATKAAMPISNALSEGVANYVTAPKHEETVDEAHAAGHQHPSESAFAYESSKNYPHTGITELSPSLDVAFAAQAAKDIGFGVGKKIVKSVSNSIAKKQALKDFIESSKTPLAEGVPTAPITAEPITELTHATSVKNSNQIMDQGFDLKKAGTGADATQDVKGFMGEGVSMAKKPGVALANVEGNLAKKETSLIKSYLPKKEVMNVTKESHPELYDALINPDPTVSKPVAESILADAKEKGFKAVSFPDGETVVTDPKAIRLLENKPLVDKSKQLEFPLQNESKGIQFNARQTKEIEKASGSTLPKTEPTFGKVTPGASTDISPQSPNVPMTEQHKLISRATDDMMKEPISPPSVLKEKPTQPLLPGAEQRIKAFADVPSNTIDARNPLTSRAELNKKVGQLEKTATDQWLAGVDAENKAIEAGLKDKTGLREVTDIKPDSLESQALFHFIENPNKMEAYGKLASTAGKETADQIAKAADYVRGKLDTILPEVNKVRAANGLDPIVHREDYITHMNEMNILSSLNKLDIMGTEQGAAIAKGIADADGVIRQTNPSLYSKLKDVVFPYVQRKNEEHATDAINAFDRYMDNAHRYIQTQPYVNELINSASAVESKNPNLANYLRQQANFISGGRSPFDKAAEMIVDKDLLRLAAQLQNNAKGNVITLNPSVPITQLFGLTSTVGKYPLRDSLLASMQSFADPSLQKYALANSPVLQTRALAAAGNDLNMGPVTKASAKLISWFDYKVAEISWMSAFKNAIRTKPLDEALNEANEWAAITQSHQGRVSTSPMMQSQLVQTVLPLMNQQVAAARSLLLNTFQGKSLTGKGIAAAKIFAYGAAVAALKSAVTGHEDNPLSPTNVLPFGGVLERGMGGPVFNSMSRLATAKSKEDAVRQVVRAAFLMQNKIPGGVMIGKQVEKALMGEPKKRKK